MHKKTYWIILSAIFAGLTIYFIFHYSDIYNFNIVFYDYSLNVTFNGLITSAIFMLISVVGLIRHR